MSSSRALVPRLKAEEDYAIDEKFRTVAITDAGIDKIEQHAGHPEHLRATWS